MKKRKEIKPATIEVPLKNGYVINIDAEDEHILKKHNFYVYLDHFNYISVRCTHNRYHILAKLIMNPLPGFMVDHINHNPLDNRKCNLRICTRQQNNWNKNIQKGRKYKGTRYDRGRYVARLHISGKCIYIGRYKTEILAALAYDQAAREYYGEFACLNFPNPLSRDEILNLYNSFGHQIFRIVFYKRSDGSYREMLCRKNVKKFINGKGQNFEPLDKNLLSVYDVVNKGYRFVPIDKIIAIKALGNKYYVYN